VGTVCASHRLEVCEVCALEDTKTTCARGDEAEDVALTPLQEAVLHVLRDREVDGHPTTRFSPLRDLVFRRGVDPLYAGHLISMERRGLIRSGYWGWYLTDKGRKIVGIMSGRRRDIVSVVSGG